MTRVGSSDYRQRKLRRTRHGRRVGGATRGFGFAVVLFAALFVASLWIRPLFWGWGGLSLLTVACAVVGWLGRRGAVAPDRYARTLVRKPWFVQSWSVGAFPTMSFIGLVLERRRQKRQMRAGF